MSDLNLPFKKRLTDFIERVDSSAFVDYDLSASRSVLDAAQTRSWLLKRNFPWYELDSRDLDLEKLCAEVIEPDRSNTAPLSSFRQLCEHIEQTPPSVIIVYRCDELASKAVQLCSRLSRFLETSNNGWKIVFIGRLSKIDPMNFKRLATQVVIQDSRHGSPGGANDSKPSNSRNFSSFIRVALLISCVALLALLFNGTFEGNSIQTAQNQDIETELTAPAGNAMRKEEASSIQNVALQNEREMQEWAQHVAEFEKVMQAYANESSYDITQGNNRNRIDSDHVSIISSNPRSAASSSWIRASRLRMSSAMQKAAETGDSGKFAAQIKGKESIEALSNNNETALIIAAMKGHTELATWLIGNNAEVNSIDNDHRSALYYAAVNGHYEIAKMLLDQKADTSNPSQLSKTPLMAAVHNNHLEIASLLIRKGANIDLQDHSGWPALFYAVWNNDARATALLINAGANLATLDKDGNSVSEIAAARNNREVLALLTKR